MQSTTQIEMLFAVLSGSKRREIQALLTTIYPIVSIENNPISGDVLVSDVRDLTQIFETPLIAGDVLIESITRQEILIEYEDTEDEILGSVVIESITQVQVLIEYEEAELDIEGAISIDSIVQVEIAVNYEEAELDIEGAVSIESITQT